MGLVLGEAALLDIVNFTAESQAHWDILLCVKLIMSVFCIAQKKYRQRVDRVKFTQVADTPSIKHAKKSQELQSGVRVTAFRLWTHLPKRHLSTCQSLHITVHTASVV